MLTNAAGEIDILAGDTDRYNRPSLQSGLVVPRTAYRWYNVGGSVGPQLLDDCWDKMKE